MNEIPRLKRIDCVDLAGGMLDELSGVLLGSGAKPSCSSAPCLQEDM